jgi:hypothetical protein
MRRLPPVLAAVATLAATLPAAAQTGLPPIPLDPASAAAIQCAPKTYKAAVQCLVKTMPRDRVETIKAEQPVMTRFSLGAFIRHNWSLRPDAPLGKAMRAMGFTTEEQMSDAIVDGFRARLLGQTFDVTAAAHQARPANAQH